jgi:hypothetical protein
LDKRIHDKTLIRVTQLIASIIQSLNKSGDGSYDTEIRKCLNRKGEWRSGIHRQGVDKDINGLISTDLSQGKDGPYSTLNVCTLKIGSQDIGATLGSHFSKLRQECPSRPVTHVVCF